MPRALTEKEKCGFCRKLLDKGSELALLHGIKKISVDDVTNAAGMAKGSFYQHFKSKEKFLCEMIEDIRKSIFEEARYLIQTSFKRRDIALYSRRAEFKQRSRKMNAARNYLVSLFQIPRMKFFLKNCGDINELYSSLPESEGDRTCYIDADMFGELIQLAGIDTRKIKSGIIHNYMHTFHLMIECDLLIQDDLHETFDLIMDSLILYIFGCENVDMKTNELSFKNARGKSRESARKGGGK